MRLWRAALAVAWKDVLCQWRTRQSIIPVVIFTLLVVVIFQFAFSADARTVLMLAPGILWVAFTFAGVLSLGQSFLAEKEDGCLEGLMLAPVGRDAIYLGKFMSGLLFLLVVEAVTLLVFGLMFNVPVLTPEFAAVTLAATAGFTGLGTLFSALALNTRARDMVLPILFLPSVVPIIIPAVQASGLALAGETWPAIASWLAVMVAFDALFIALSFLVFELVLEK